MSRLTCIVLIALLVVPCISQAETIDVHIKGVDDGVKTTKQQDYKEAVLFAKREAVERAGVMIKAITTVKDLVLNSDYIESQAEAVLLPGYNIIDMGYSENGTYQVVLIGKIRTNDQETKTFIVKISEDVSIPLGMTYKEVFSIVEKKKLKAENIKCETYLLPFYRDNTPRRLSYVAHCPWTAVFPNRWGYYFDFKNNLLYAVTIDLSFSDVRSDDSFLIEEFNKMSKIFTLKYGKAVFNNNYDKAWATSSTYISLKYNTSTKYLSESYCLKNY